MTKTTHCRLGVAIVIALLLLGAGFATAYADGEGAISGKVQNKTPGGGSVSGIEVTLRTLAHQAQGSTTTTTTDNDGNFRFDKLVTANNYAYSVGLKYQGVTYGSDLVVFQSGETSKTSDIAVYETVDKPDTLVIQRAHVIIGISAETLTMPVMEILIVENRGDRVVVPSGAGKGTLRVTWPNGAQKPQLAPDIAGGALEIPGGFTYNMPLLPGTSELLYTYELRFKSSGYDLSRSFDYPVQQLSVLVPDKGVKATSDKLAPQPPAKLGDPPQSYLHLLGSDIAPGSAVSVRLEGLPTPSPIPALPDILRWALPAIIGLGFVGLIVLALLRRRQTPGEDEEAAAEDELAGDDDFADDDFAGEPAGDVEPIAEERPRKRG